ncbi:dephospho-CoA kinase [Oscillatoria sp. CS-180]|uniref:dephospho-CoA kinase n=1 Tax=Oscillatoria sp. CS-180 TaxID=3021720 RepID=UPI0023301174|nr:dephospho-CoA kinase [Oscillatoria sp. CS-180]MDB9526726.1 dephospho-CoA kinase [Oscillatoria sp. CS-180]
MGQRIIGLTGGIATGKSTVSRYLEARYGLPILDADAYARQAVAPGSKILTAIAERYSQSILNDDNTLNRSQLGQIIFNDAAEKLWVEQQIHPFVRQQFIEEMRKVAMLPVVVQSIPLLFEADLTDQVTEIWVVACSEEVQRARLIARDHLSLPAATARIANQWPLQQKIELADVVLDNTLTLENLYQQVNHALAVN